MPDSVRLCFWFFVEFEGRSCSTHSMPRRPRIEFEGAIYHVMARGNARQRIVGDDHDRERLLDDLRRTVLRCGWELLAFVFMENHLHLLLKTPRPNLARGMEHSSRRTPSGTDDDIVESGICSRDGTGPNSSRMRATIGPSAGISTSIRSGLGCRMPGRMAVASYPGFAKLPSACPGSPMRPCSRPGVASTGGPIHASYWRLWGRSEQSPPSPFREAFGGWVLGRSGSSLGCGSCPGLSCLIHRFRVLVNWPRAIRRPSSRRFVITSVSFVRLSRVAAIPTSLERPPPGSAASTANSRCMNWLPCSASLGPTASPP